VCFSKYFDNFFNVIVILSIFLFSLEFYINIKEEKNYSFSYYFFLDLLSTVLLVVDLTWLSDQVFYKDR